MFQVRTNLIKSILEMDASSLQAIAQVSRALFIMTVVTEEVSAEAQVREPFFLGGGGGCCKDTTGSLSSGRERGKASGNTGFRDFRS